MNQRLLNAAAVVFMLCSVTGTSAFVWSTLTRTQTRPAPPTASFVKEWRGIGRVGHSRGPADAPVTIVEFADYECPACRAFEATINEVARRHAGDVRIVFRHFPLTSIHPHAFLAAMAAECASDQGRFEEYHRLLYATQDSLGLIDWVALARRANVPDLTKFGRCTQAGQHAETVQRDADEARQLRLAGTPSLLINDSLAAGGLPLELLERAIAARTADAKR